MSFKGWLSTQPLESDAAGLTRSLRSPQSMQAMPDNIVAYNQLSAHMQNMGFTTEADYSEADRLWKRFSRWWNHRR